MRICKALLKYDYENFSIEILEYCDSSELLTRERNYIDLLLSEYNISKEPGSIFLGRKHSEESKQKISDAMKGEIILTLVSQDTKELANRLKK
jgi:group I intron endonuclease